MEIDQQLAWQAVLNRDHGYDGRFVFAVSTTGIYCRPSCPARRPRRENVTLFATPEAAERAAFRACLRCHPAATITPVSQRAMSILNEHADDGITLEELALQLGSSAHHLQRTFKRETGVTPKQYLAARRSERFKEQLKEGSMIAAATYEAGYGSSSRVYSTASERLGMTPASYRKGGAGLSIHFLTSPVAAGTLLAAWTDRGLCSVTLGDDAKELEQQLRGEFPKAAIAAAIEDDAMTATIRSVISQVDCGELRIDIPLDIRATLFQMQVWCALRRIPRGQTRTYSEVAESIGRPASVRAVANACAANAVALVIPCHRVVREDGELGGYRWGVDRKRFLLERELKN